MRKVENYFKHLYVNREYSKLMGYSTLLLLAFFLLLILGLIIICAIGNILITIIMNNQNVIAFFICLVLFIIYIKQNDIGKSNSKETSSKSLDENIISIDVSYKIIAKELYMILSELADILNLIKPHDFTEIFQIQKVITSNKGFTIYRYVFIKKGDVDIKTIKQLFSFKLEQQMNAKISTINKDYFNYKGKMYLPFAVHCVEDVGQYVQFDIAGVNEAYCQQLSYVESMLNNEKFKEPVKIIEGDFK